MNKVNARRRLALFMMGGGCLERVIQTGWVKPTVDTVMVPAHAVMTGLMEIDCSITRGFEGQAPRVNGANFDIDTVMEVISPEAAEGDTADVLHEVDAAGFSQSFPGALNVGAEDRLFVGGVPGSIPLPAGVAGGQDLRVTVTTGHTRR